MPIMPSAFFGHGSPMNTIARNAYTESWRRYAGTLPVPRAILAISAHWYTPGTWIGVARRPPTIHDFNSRFPPQLFEYVYPAQTDAELVERVIELAQPVAVKRDATSWGIDHGAYSILAHLVPNADIPVVMLSIDRTRPPRDHYELGARLAPLRGEGVLIMGSGNIVHNLELSDATPGAEPYIWARRFDELVHELLAAGDHAALVDYHRLGPDARLSVPTPEHYLPLLYTIGAQRAGQAVTPIVEGLDFRSGSMLSVSIAG